MESFVSFTWTALVIFWCCNKIPNFLIVYLLIIYILNICSLGTLICFFLLVRAFWLSHDVRYQSGKVCQRDRSCGGKARSETDRGQAYSLFSSTSRASQTRVPWELHACPLWAMPQWLLSSHWALLLKTLSGQHCHPGDETPRHPCQGDTLTPLHTRAVIFSTMVSPVREVQTFEQKKGNVQKLQLDMALAAVVTSELEACYHQNLPHEIIGEIFSIYESKLVCRKPMEYQDWVIPFYITKIHLGKLSCTFN